MNTKWERLGLPALIAWAIAAVAAAFWSYSPAASYVALVGKLPWIFACFATLLVLPALGCWANTTSRQWVVHGLYAVICVSTVTAGVGLYQATQPAERVVDLADASLPLVKWNPRSPEALRNMGLLALAKASPQALQDALPQIAQQQALLDHAFIGTAAVSRASLYASVAPNAAALKRVWQSGILTQNDDNAWRQRAIAAVTAGNVSTEGRLDFMKSLAQVAPDERNKQ